MGMEVEEDEMRGESYKIIETRATERQSLNISFLTMNFLSVSLEDSACNAGGTFIFTVWAHFPDAGWFLLRGLICMMNENLCI